MFAERLENKLLENIQKAIEWVGKLKRILPSGRISIKPKFTYPYYKRSVTSSPNAIEETVKILKEYIRGFAIVETDGLIYYTILLEIETIKKQKRPI